MKILARLLGVVALAVALSLAMHGNGGYALFVLPPWRAEISLNMLIVLAVTVFAVAYVLVRAARQTLQLPARVRAFRNSRRDEKGRATLLRAIQALFEGRFLHAEKLASEASRLRSVPALAGLIAARAAQRLREFSRRDHWLEQARRDDGDWRSARLMTAAELLLEEQRFDEARAALRELYENGPRHAATLLLLLRAEQGLSNWDEVIRIAKLLEKHAAMPAEALESIRVNARLARLEHLAQDRQGLSDYWGEVPQAERVHRRIAAAAAQAFMRSGDFRSARRTIERALERDWNADLALLYGECTGGEEIEQLERAESWLRQRPGDADLLLTLGRLCVERGLWGKAQSYLEASLATRPGPAAHVALARLFDRMDRTEEANRHFRASAGLAPERGASV
jgi:HemY protein